jgi:D-tyrosyl-tRNA(Tyr) deacylase
MRAVVQRVTRASVTVDGRVEGSIGGGLVVLLGVASEDTRRDVDYLVDKIIGLRVFPDEQQKMNRSVLDAGGSLLVISQFTLYGDCRRGRRPSFDAAAPPELAGSLYEAFLEGVRSKGVSVANGVFQAHMQVELVNDGPVTILFDSAKLF